MFRSFAKRVAGWFRAENGHREMLENASLLQENGDIGKALETLNRMIEGGADAGGYERRARLLHQLGRDDEALADLDEAIRLDPEPFMYWYSRAILRNERGEYEAAAEDFREALRRKDDARSSTYFELGNVYLRLERFEDAETCFRLSCEAPDQVIPHFFYRRAQALEALNRAEEALPILMEAIRLNDLWKTAADKGASEIRRRTRYSSEAVKSILHITEEEFGFRLYLSKLYERLGNHQDAIEAVEEALPDYPDAAELQLRRGTALRNLGRLAESENLLKDIQNRNPSWLPVSLELCATLRQQEKFAEAVAVLRETKARFPDNMVVRYWLADVLREAERGEEAIAENRILTELEPNDPLNWKQQGELAIDADRFEEADYAYTRALQLDDKADYYMRRSFARYMDDRYEDALLDIQSAMERDIGLQHDSKTAYALAELFVGMENWELAEMEYSRAIATDPENPQIYDRRARCRAAAEKWTDAVDDCNRGLALDGSNAKLLWLRGYLHFKMDEYDSALRDTLTYAKLRPEDPKGHYNLGLVYKKLYRYDEAIGSFTKAMELNPFEPQTYLERASIWYHHAFDRIRAADDLAQWMIYTGSAEGEDAQDKLSLLAELPGFDDELRERAMEQFRTVIDSSRYLS
ncbi:tetratricopeptide repeat protein [Cohnella sp. CFH 77786]|uniref:tetratricopeptide repeat protein n=1 Tax=Cohnella sp. CFH 77786 TaxID=2662265 RepID=UPI001C60C802|nr:tetratricopeptide repeat protein [Cohnella sp. CFH 77786]MBW5448130.1 tetratricopeptide repeat protein [Cohnella sp. CFH 77786]